MRAGFALLAILVSAAAQRPAHARADDAEDARRLFEQAGEARRSGRLVDARDLLRRSLALHPSRATAFNLALTLHKKGDDQSAVEEYKKAIAMSPSDASFHFALALSYERLQRTSDAVAAYEEYLRLAPAAGDAEKIRARIAQLTGSPAAGAPAPSNPGNPQTF